MLSVRVPGFQEVRERAASVDWLQWDWAAFWPDLSAGILTFALGIVAAYFLLRYELRANRRMQFEEFQTLANEVYKDFADLGPILQAWRDQVAAKQVITLDTRHLTWELDELNLRHAFSSYGVQHTTQQAVTWYRSAVEIARQWNIELNAGIVTESTHREAIIRLPAAEAKLLTAMERLREVANITPGG